MRYYATAFPVFPLRQILGIKRNLILLSDDF